MVYTEKRQRGDHRCGEHYCTSCQQHVLYDHLCYLRAIPAEEDFRPKFIFFDFECTQADVGQCSARYESSKMPNCADCETDQPCKACTKCKHCWTSRCGKAVHRPNFVAAHSVCPECIDKPLTSESVCQKCGTRCEECDNVDLYDNEDTGPCPGTCGFRETILQGENTTNEFGRWLFSDQHRHCTTVAHNMKGYDGYFLLE